MSYFYFKRDGSPKMKRLCFMTLLFAVPTLNQFFSIGKSQFLFHHTLNLCLGSVSDYSMYPYFLPGSWWNRDYIFYIKYPIKGDPLIGGIFAF